MFRYFTWSCPNCEKSIKEVDCFGDGKYCAATSFTGNEEGNRIILENLRQKCVFLLSKFNGASHKWWEYIRTRNSLLETNPKCEDRFSVDCSKLVHSRIKMDYAETEK